MRLIDADALIKTLKSNCKPELCHDYKNAWCEACCPYNNFEDLIDNAPTAELEPASDYQKGVLELVDNLKDKGVINNMEKGKLRRAILLEPDKPHGKWEEDWQEDLDFMSRKGWKCPFCKWRTTYGTPNFCMNCGADLRQEESE